MKKRELPRYVSFPEATRLSPVQTETTRPSFLITAEDGREHTVTPLYKYKIAGMVVSCRHSKELSDYYKDKLNIMDVGLIWGENLNPEIYRKIKFYSSGVRLFWQSKDQEIFRQLNRHKVSNNHLV
ncbi:MAG: hypothetical protein PF904_01955 [Kiritimatiellae bacterium]|jgi:hypothetical protein|nr:hypothetical protein [Kiritimatiellia bacterium]